MLRTHLLPVIQGSILDDTTIMSFRHLREMNGLTAGILAEINGHLCERGCQGTIDCFCSGMRAVVHCFYFFRL